MREEDSYDTERRSGWKRATRPAREEQRGGGEGNGDRAQRLLLPCLALLPSLAPAVPVLCRPVPASQPSQATNQRACLFASSRIRSRSRSRSREPACREFGNRVATPRTLPERSGRLIDYCTVRSTEFSQPASQPASKRGGQSVLVPISRAELSPKKDGGRQKAQGGLSSNTPETAGSSNPAEHRPTDTD